MKRKLNAFSKPREMHLGFGRRLWGNGTMGTSKAGY